MDATTERAPAAYLSYAEARRVITGILLAMFLAALNQTIVATALPTIGRDLQDFENLSWTVTAYLLTSTVVASLYGKLSDIHGRRAVMLARDRHLRGRLGDLRARAQHADPGARPRPAGARRRRHHAARPGDHRRRERAARARPLPGDHRHRLGRRRHRRPGGRRLHRRAPALVADLLDQRADGHRGRLAHQRGAQAPAAQRALAPARHPGRQPDDVRRDRAPARAHLGRHALPVGLAADRRRCSRSRSAFAAGVPLAHRPRRRAVPAAADPRGTRWC